MIDEKSLKIAKTSILPIMEGRIELHCDPFVWFWSVLNRDYAVLGHVTFSEILEMKWRQ